MPTKKKPAAPRRYTKVDANGLLLPDTALTWVAVHDIGPAGMRFNEPLYWLVAESKRMPFKAIGDYCAKQTALGRTDWRAPSRMWLQSLCDIERRDPCIDTDFFPHCEAAGYWSGDVLAPRRGASSPSDGAYVVYFDVGHVDWNGQSYECFVRPVRVGQ